MHIPLLCLLGFVAWTVLIVVVGIAGVRFTALATGTAGLGVVSGDVNGLPFTVPADGAESHSFSVDNVALTPGLNTIIARAKSRS